jgi:hypothetical protein
MLAAYVGASETEFMTQEVAKKQARLDAAFIDDAIDGDADSLVGDGHSVPPVVSLSSG